MQRARSAAESRIFVKFAEDGSHDGCYIEGANIEITPPMPITEEAQGEEILKVIPAHYEDDAEKGTVLVPEQRIGTGRYETIQKIVGYTEEAFNPALPPEYEEVTYDQYQKLVGNDPEGVFIRDPKTKEYILKPPYVPTADDKLAILDAEYESKIKEVNQTILLATAEGDKELQAEAVAEKAALKAEYIKKRGEINE